MKLLFVVVLLISLGVQSVLAKDIFEQSVLIEQNASNQDLQKLVSTALKQSLVQYSLDISVADNPTVRRALQNAQSFVLSKRTQATQQFATNVIGASVPLNQHIFVFDQQKIRSLFLQANINVLDIKRPATLVLVISQTDQGLSLVNDEVSMENRLSNPPHNGHVFANLAYFSQQVALPLITVNTRSSKMGIEELTALWLGDPLAVERIKDQYAVDFVLLVKVRQQQQIMVASYLLGNQPSPEWRAVKNFSEAAAVSIAALSTYFIKKYGNRLHAAASGDINLQFNLVPTLAQFRKIERALQGIAGVKQVMAYKVNGRTVWFRLQLSNSKTRFLDSLQINPAFKILSRTQADSEIIVQFN